MIKPLSKQQEEVLQGAADGETLKETAARMGISEPTVNLYHVNLRSKLRAKNKTNAVAIALRLGFIK
jgi:DNA-binding NarL/FixJ family response regulator